MLRVSDSAGPTRNSLYNVTCFAKRIDRLLRSVVMALVHYSAISRDYFRTIGLITHLAWPNASPPTPSPAFWAQSRRSNNIRLLGFRLFHYLPFKLLDSFFDLTSRLIFIQPGNVNLQVGSLVTRAEIGDVLLNLSQVQFLLLWG